ncbi:hypothetical protein CYMTET_4841 [Cymbomonas tetramitiformis]|uniref:Uncharacterized protein n=1 Tax=Cymbomonas tetramitiformis TaxID=36881 RepID=A0AAE0LK39_9CHLO|nr:hypothetical protein CYMTET_4841 [Cymbomonas tetramitiformis]
MTHSPPPSSALREQPTWPAVLTPSAKPAHESFCAQLTTDLCHELLENLPARNAELERKLCLAVLANEKIARHEVERALLLKSFDYRVLNLLLYKARGVSVNEDYMHFLAASEMLVEISDDLFDYEEDVASNAFNVYRMFIHMYGAHQAGKELAQYIQALEGVYQQRLQLLPADLSCKYQQRCRDAFRSGGGAIQDDQDDGRWTLPAPITNELSFRRRISAA